MWRDIENNLIIPLFPSTRLTIENLIEVIKCSSYSSSVTCKIKLDNRYGNLYNRKQIINVETYYTKNLKGEEGNNTNVQLTVPAGSAQAKEYTATITWTLTAGPTDAQ